MKILLVHNFYQQPGGEDEVFRAEGELLESFGQQVLRYTVHNDRIKSMGRFETMRKTFSNREICGEIKSLVERGDVEVVHFHNIFPLISPAAYAAARAGGAAIVQTLHNARLLCPGGILFRDGKPCLDCVTKKFAWPGVVHGCYRGSRSASAVLAGMTAAHRLTGTYHKQVDAYIVMTDFARQLFTRTCLPVEKLFIKPHFVSPDPGIGPGDGGYALFVSRLSKGKGVETMLRTWKNLRATIPLKIVGDGDLADLVCEAAQNDSRIEWLGRRPCEEVYDLMGRAAAVLFPSECIESFGRVMIEAYAKGTPVIASDNGAMKELISRGKTGELFTTGDSAALADVVSQLFAHPTKLTQMRPHARAAYEARYSDGNNYQQLMQIYDAAIEQRRIDAPHSVRSCEAS